MSVRIGQSWGSGSVVVPDTVDELVTDVGWQARCDQVRAALHRTWLPVYGGHVRDEITADRQGVAR